MNFQVVKETVAYARSLEEKYGKHFRFTTTTNGILLDEEKAEFLNREMNNVVLSLDGRREVNGRYAPQRGGKAVTDTIVPALSEVCGPAGG